MVTPWNVAGSGQSTTSVPVTPTTTCATDACVTLDATSPIGPANHADSGILSSVFDVGNLLTDLASLDTTMYVGSPTYNADGTFNWGNWNLAAATARRPN